jgi:hypothetical protein
VPRITDARLVALTHIPEKPVRAFLRAQRGVSLTVEHSQARAKRLKEAYAQLVAAGKIPPRMCCACERTPAGTAPCSSWRKCVNSNQRGKAPRAWQECERNEQEREGKTTPTAFPLDKQKSTRGTRYNTKE